MRKGIPFLRTSLASEGTRAAVDKALSRLVSTGVLERVARGVYMRPKQIEFVGAGWRAHHECARRFLATEDAENDENQWASAAGLTTNHTSGLRQWRLTLAQALKLSLSG